MYCHAPHEIGACCHQAEGDNGAVRVANRMHRPIGDVLDQCRQVVDILSDTTGSVTILAPTVTSPIPGNHPVIMVKLGYDLLPI